MYQQAMVVQDPEDSLSIRVDVWGGWTGFLPRSMMILKYRSIIPILSKAKESEIKYREGCR